MKGIPVEQFMERDPIAVTPETPLPELVATLRRGGYRALPVTDAGGRLLGVVSETDLFLKPRAVPFSTEKVPSLVGKVIDREQVDQVDHVRRMNVGEVMHANAVTVRRDTTLEELATVMSERSLSMIPVVEGERLVGVARRGDVLEIIYRAAG